MCVCLSVLMVRFFANIPQFLHGQHPLDRGASPRRCQSRVGLLPPRHTPLEAARLENRGQARHPPGLEVARGRAGAVQRRFAPRDRDTGVSGAPPFGEPRRRCRAGSDEEGKPCEWTCVCRALDGEEGDDEGGGREGTGGGLGETRVCILYNTRIFVFLLLLLKGSYRTRAHAVRDKYCCRVMYSYYAIISYQVRYL